MDDNTEARMLLAKEAGTLRGMGIVAEERLAHIHDTAAQVHDTFHEARQLVERYQAAADAGVKDPGDIEALKDAVNLFPEIGRALANITTEATEALLHIGGVSLRCGYIVNSDLGWEASRRVDVVARAKVMAQAHQAASGGGCGEGVDSD